MSNIILKDISINNFKGIRSFSAPFQSVTSIYGENGAGKTTVFDAFLWLFFGKNSEDVSQFQIKRLDANNQFIKDVVTEVSATVIVGNNEITIRKELRQKWPKRRGEERSHYAGDENLFFWNDVPMKEVEFKTKVSNIVPEKLFRLITDPFHFNAIKWQDRRNALIEMAGDVTNNQVFAALQVDQSQNSVYTGLIQAFQKNKSLEEFKRELTAKKGLIKNDLDEIPNRIDEVQRTITDKDFSECHLHFEQLQVELSEVQSLINNEVAQKAKETQRINEDLEKYNKELLEHQSRGFGLRNSLREISFTTKQQVGEIPAKIRAKIASLKTSCADKLQNLERYRASVIDLESLVSLNEVELQRLRIEYSNVDASAMPEFDDNNFCCPTCKRTLPEENIAAQKETLTENFNNDKVMKKEALKDTAAKLHEDNKTLTVRIDNGRQFITKLSTEIKEIEEETATLESDLYNVVPEEEAVQLSLSTNESYKDLQRQLTAHDSIKLTPPIYSVKPDDDLLSNRRSAINVQIVNVTKELAEEELNIKAKARLAELHQRQEELTNSLLALESSEYAIQQFSKAKIEAIESRINGLFSIVKFKMFNSQVNGGETECCETLINGVPFSDANNAAKINAGIDIINALCQHYRITAPVFIDNRESVTSLIDSASQIVNLIVSPSDKHLRVA